MEWNNLRAANESDYTVPNARIIGHDVTGGFFSLNGGKWPNDIGGVYYWGQNSLEWTNLETTYSGWLQWVLNGNLEQFYEGLRWPGWQDEIAPLALDQGVSIYPFPWAAEGGSIASRSRRPVAMRELWDVSTEIAAQLRDLPSGSRVDIDVIEGDLPEKPP